MNEIAKPIMRKYFRSVLFSKTPLRSQFRFEDRFQILPIVSENAPYSPYARHFPLFIEYFIDYNEKEFPEGMGLIKETEARQVVEDEYINLLSVLSNHHFFKYRGNQFNWGIKTPNEGFEKLLPEEEAEYENQVCTWIIGGYVYPGLKEDLKIDGFSDFKSPVTPFVSTYYQYFTTDPVDDEKKEIKFPETIYDCLINYFQLSPKISKKVRSSILLICDGIEISDYKRSLAFLSYVSAIEAFVELEYSDKEIEFECHSCKAIKSSPHVCKVCGKPIWGIKTKFKEFLTNYVAGSESSVMKYNKIYNLRCRIAHTGQLFISDYEFSLDNHKDADAEWLMKLETLQIARIGITNWLLNKKSLPLTLPKRQ